MSDARKQTHLQRLPYSLTLTIRDASVSTLDLNRLEPINDANQREFHQPNIGNKLLTIFSMALVIAGLVWSMG
jgi:hypothetical protein